MKILSGEFHEGDTLQVDRGKGGLVFSSQPQGEPVHA